MGQIRKEMLEHKFNPLHPLITQRNLFITRNHRTLGNPSVEKCPVTLESGKKVHVYRFNFLHVYQQHLQGHEFADLDNLILPDKTRPWESFPRREPTYDKINNSEW
jgi:hypothetical protein